MEIKIINGKSYFLGDLSQIKCYTKADVNRTIKQREYRQRKKRLQQELLNSKHLANS